MLYPEVCLDLEKEIVFIRSAATCKSFPQRQPDVGHVQHASRACVDPSSYLATSTTDLRPAAARVAAPERGMMGRSLSAFTPAINASRTLLGFTVCQGLL